MLIVVPPETMQLSGAAFYLPQTRIFADILLAEIREHVQMLRNRFKSTPLFLEFPGFGIESVSVAESETRLQMARHAATAALVDAGISAEELDLCVDFSTIGHRQGDLGLELLSTLGAGNSMHLAIRSGGCAAFHIAMLTVAGYFSANPSLRTVLLFSSDRIPRRSRYCFPLSVLGDGASALVLTRNTGNCPWKVIATGSLCAPALFQAVPLPDHQDQPVNANIEVFENYLMPVYFKGLYDTVQAVLRAAGTQLIDTDFIYSNMSDFDCAGTQRAMHIATEQFFRADFTNTGHIMASDMIINFCRYREQHPNPNSSVLLAGAGGGFYWGATLLRSQGVQD